MATHYLYTAWITLGVSLHLHGNAMRVGRARRTFDVPAPTTHGPEGFERAYRVQMNTIEAAVAFLPAMWICATWFGDGAAALCGLGWLASRIAYAHAYTRHPRWRLPAYATTVGSLLAAVVLAAAGLITG
ncbi:MAPEG family protein [Chitinolyticbacter albus]|uniref:MAPEG family protein n=1 Tax=Chitinolyticbacter albus TaxID=2961951 RepID=UPI00210BADBA|nr:MAPEG family protein [Chitinolyticbacter albus]